MISTTFIVFGLFFFLFMVVVLPEMLISYKENYAKETIWVRLPAILAMVIIPTILLIFVLVSI